MEKGKKSIIYGASAVLSWSTVATAFKIAGQYMTPYVMVLVASVTALVILSAVVACSGRMRAVSKLSGRDWWSMALIGLINPVVYYLVLFMAYAQLPAQVAQPVNYTWPILLLLLLAVIGKERIAGYKYIGMAISLAGLTIISFGGKAALSTVTAEGVALGLLSALLWATYWLLNRKLCAHIDSLVSTFGTFLFGSVYLLIAACFMPLPQLTMPALLSGAYIGAFEMAVPFVLFGLALRTTDNPALINQMCYLSPFISLLFISTVLGEPILVTTYIGLALIVGGIAFNELYKK